MINIADLLCKSIAEKRSPIVVGLDPVVSRIPRCYYEENSSKHPLELVGDAFLRFNRDIIDAVADVVPAVKPQMAFYEKYGSYGIRAFEKTVSYAKDAGLIVIEDAKRNDIGNTACAYADGHLGRVETISGELIPSYNADFLTVSPFLGSESLQPFVNVCKKHNKGIFILAKTSNKSSGEIQEARCAKDKTVSEYLGNLIADYSQEFVGTLGYSPIGAVVGATYPEEARYLRKIMPQSLFLVPGYGAQGATSIDVVPNFNDDGFGAIVNSSRNIVFAYENLWSKGGCTQKQYIECTRLAAEKMRDDIYQALRCVCKDMAY